MLLFTGTKYCSWRLAVDCCPQQWAGGDESVAADGCPSALWQREARRKLSVSAGHSKNTTSWPSEAGIRRAGRAQAITLIAEHRPELESFCVVLELPGA